MNRKQALLEFERHFKHTREGAVFEIGEAFDLAAGWRVYVRIGDKTFVYSASFVRSLADQFEAMAHRPEWRGSAAWARDNVATLRGAALVVVYKNRDRVVPDGYIEVMPTMGNA